MVMDRMVRFIHNMPKEEFIDDDKHYVCYTDGSGLTSENLNPERICGSGYIILHKGKVVKYNAKGFKYTNVQRMEMLAIISALASCPEGAYVDLYSDSQYAVYAFSCDKMIAKKNFDLLDRYKEYTKHLDGIRLHWIKGHNGNRWNEIVDDLASSAFYDLAKKNGVKAKKRVNPFAIMNVEKIERVCTYHQ